MSGGGGGGKDRGTRDARERARLYEARLSYHDTQIRRRTRDNVIGGIVGGLAIVLIFAVQTLYFTVGPGMPEPTPEPTPVSTVDPTPVVTDTPLPEPSPAATE